MPDEYTTEMPRGISHGHREMLSRLHLAFTRPFTSAEAAQCLGLSSTRTNRLLAHWASNGWLSRVKRGLYVTVPLDAISPGDWRVDPWVIARALFTPCYVGGWSAAEHWGLTDQIFRDVVVFSASGSRRRYQKIKGSGFVVVSITEDRVSDTKTVWRDGERVFVSSPARTLVDVLDRPRLGGGIRHIAGITAEFFRGSHRDEGDLLRILRTWNNRTVCKRLGYLIETCSLDAEAVLSFCLSSISAGYSRLDPSIRGKGRLLRRWMLEVNAGICSEGRE